MITKKSDVIRFYLPPDANCLLSCYDHCARSKNYVNVIIASKHPSYQWLDMKSAKEHCKKGISEWKWAGLNDTKNPDIVLACCGDTPTLETLATVSLIKKYLPKMNVRVINIVDLMTLVSSDVHTHGLSNEEYDKLFTIDKHIFFNFHGYPQLIHGLTYSRKNKNLHVSGYKEEGTITTPFDMRVLNGIDRFHQMLKILKYADIEKDKAKELKALFENKLKEHIAYITENGIDMPEILDWKWE